MQPELVILDTALPSRGGWDVLTEVRTLDETRDLPIVVITAQGQSSGAAEARRRGADVFIEKPFRIEVLAEAVSRLLAEGSPRDGSVPAA